MKYNFFEYPEGKTNYSIVDEHGNQSTITLEKWIADILQSNLDDVHNSIQRVYNKINFNHPSLSRRKKGDILRVAARRKANKFQETKKVILGWCENDLEDF